jgi:hypothetical protein
MIFPKNGRIVVLDDQIEQGLPLVKAFAKKGIPCCYFTGNQKELPEKPFEDLRILALDLNLTDAISFQNARATLINCIKKIVSTESKYIVLIWSVKENEFTAGLNALFDNELRDVRPISRIPLHKTDFFIHTRQNGYRPRKDFMRKLNKRLWEGLKSNNVLALVILWENLIHECAGSMIRKFSSFVEKDSHFDENLRHIFYKMAHAQVGRNLKKMKKAEVLKNGLQTFNDAFIDEINSALIMKNNNIEHLDIKRLGNTYQQTFGNDVFKLVWDNFEKYLVYVNGSPISGELDAFNSVKVKEILIKGTNARIQQLKPFLDKYFPISPVINTALLLDLAPSKYLRPGNIFEMQEPIKNRRRRIKEYLNKINDKDGEGKFKYKISGIKFVELEISPVCDYAQKKWKCSRFVEGIMLPEGIPLSSKDSGYLYSEAPIFKVGNKFFTLIFNFHYLTTKKINNSRKPFLRIKDELLRDIVAKFSVHANRPAVTCVE